MAAEMVKAIMKAEATGREMEGVAEKTVEKMLSDAEIQAQIIIKSAIDQAKNQANIILSDETLNGFPLRSKTRQGCLPSSLLLNIGPKFLASAIMQRK